MLRFLTATSSTAREIYKYKRRARKHMATERGLYSIGIIHNKDCLKKFTRQLELLSVRRGLYVYTVLLKAAVLNT